MTDEKKPIRGDDDHVDEPSHGDGLARSRSMAFLAGVSAWALGKKLEDNPFPEGSAEAKKWSDGLKSAAADSAVHGQKDGPKGGR